jgi:CubicO group peptidase (beta-lactamase class C family)
MVSPSLARADKKDAPSLPKTFDVKLIDEYLAAQLKAKRTVGLSVAIMKEGKFVLAKAYGKASLKPEADVDVETMFAAGSVTKQFTCACILLLAEDGKLSVHDKVAKYYPNLTQAKDITLYDLMTHASGYPDYYPLDFVDRRMLKPIALDKLITEYAGGKLDFEPGTKWSYSNTGYIILGRVIEKVSGKSFAQFLDERIFKPLGMKSSIDEPALGGKGLAVGYTSQFLGDVEPARPEAEGWIQAAGGLYTTPSDLVRWDLALMDGKVLKPESYQLMTTRRKLADSRLCDYGCGLGVGLRDGETVLAHGGAVSGFLTFNTMLPRTKSALALMTNSEHVDLKALQGELMKLLIEATHRAAMIPKIDGPPAKDAALDFLHQLQEGKVKRDQLGEEYSVFLTDKRIDTAKERLKPLGEPEKVEVDDTHERGGMEVAVIRFNFKNVKLKASLYRTPDGKIQQFLIKKS